MGVRPLPAETGKSSRNGHSARGDLLVSRCPRSVRAATAQRTRRPRLYGIAKGYSPLPSQSDRRTRSPPTKPPNVRHTARGRTQRWARQWTQGAHRQEHPAMATRQAVGWPRGPICGDVVLHRGCTARGAAGTTTGQPTSLVAARSSRPAHHAGRPSPRGVTPARRAKEGEAAQATGGRSHTPTPIAIHSTIDRPDEARLGRPSGPPEAPRSTQVHPPHHLPPPVAPNAPSSTWSVKRVVAALAITATRGMPRPAAGETARLRNRTRVAATVARAATSAVPTADNAAPPAAATVTVRVVVVPGGVASAVRSGKGGARSRTIKLGETAGRRSHAQMAGPRLPPPPSYPPLCQRATAPREPARGRQRAGAGLTTSR